MNSVETFDIVEEFKKCMLTAPVEVKEEFSYWCLGKNSNDTYDISISLDEYIEKIHSILDGTYDKSFNYVTYVSLTDNYDFIFNEYYNNDYSNLFKLKINVTNAYRIRNTNNMLYSCFLTEAIPKSKFKLSFLSFYTNCCCLLVTHDRFKSFDEFTLLKTAAYWNEYFKKHFNWLNEYKFLFIFTNRNKILCSNKILSNDDSKRYKININNKQVLHSLIYEN